MTLNVFDLDKTLIDGDSNELWHEFLLEKQILDDEFLKEDKRLMDLYAKGELDMDEYLKFAVEAFTKLDIFQTQNLMSEYLENKIKPIIHKEAQEWIKNSTHSLIISGTPEFIVKNVANLLGIKEAIGMRLIIKENYFTNIYEKPLSYQEGKIECLKNWLDAQELKFTNIVFYTDSINDLPLCKFADEAICVNPDESLEKEANQNGWKIYKI